MNTAIIIDEAAMEVWRVERKRFNDLITRSRAAGSVSPADHRKLISLVTKSIKGVPGVHHSLCAEQALAVQRVNSDCPLPSRIISFLGAQLDAVVFLKAGVPA
jgi:hypothetical protein